MVLGMDSLNPLQSHSSRVYRIHVLGAESTGKSTLVETLAQLLRKHQGEVIGVPEGLRAWVAQQGRTPKAAEQLALADAQEQAIAQACFALTQHPNPTRWVLADTSPFMTAAYSAHYFNDDSLWPRATDFESTADLRLLMGLDLPWQADGAQRDGPAHQTAVDRLLRDTLQDKRLPFTVIYGQGEARTQAAWRAVQAMLRARHGAQTDGREATRRTWRAVCDCCADPACELALFTQRSA